MAECINVYCDESCHLEHDGINVMGLGAVYCVSEKVAEANRRIKEIKLRNGVSSTAEVKWTKISPAKAQLYADLVNYFFDDDDLHFRCLLVPDKSKLRHGDFNQSHDDWYYKMYFEMLKVIFYPRNSYKVYVDIKDTHSAERVRKLQDVCRNDLYDFQHNIIKRIQPIRSNEVQLMQLVDVLLGTVVFSNRIFQDGLSRSDTKHDIVRLVASRSGYSLKKTTLLREDKFNLFVWSANYGM